VVYVPDRPDIHVRLPPLIFRLRHARSLPSSLKIYSITHPDTWQ
jgi:hypothetical protein